MNARCSCPACDEVIVVGCVTLRVGPETYGFDCPACGAEVIKEAGPPIIDLLMASGVRPPICEADVDCLVAELDAGTLR